jgi:hypothetical protein
MLIILVKLPNIKFHENMFSCSQAITCKQMDKQGKDNRCTVGNMPKNSLLLYELNCGLTAKKCVGVKQMIILHLIFALGDETPKMHSIPPGLMSVSASSMAGA